MTTEKTNCKIDRDEQQAKLLIKGVPVEIKINVLSDIKVIDFDDGPMDIEEFPEFAEQLVLKCLRRLANEMWMGDIYYFD